MVEHKSIRWGIIGPGRIAQTFARNILRDIHTSKDRDEKSITHVITGVASSTSLSTAAAFITNHVEPYQSQAPLLTASKENRSKAKCTPHSSYLSLITSSDVDVVYVATPHTAHFQPAFLALQHGKAVLVEKPICVNTAQAEVLVNLARQQGVFLMEAVWTRFFPLTNWVREMISKGDTSGEMGIGEVVRMNADFSLGVSDDQEGWEGHVGGMEGRLLNSKLAGGVLLDLGIYCLTWIFMVAYHTLPPKQRKQPTLVGAAMTPSVPADTVSAESNSSQHDSLQQWVDKSTTLLLTLPSAPSGASICHAVATTSITTTTDPGYGGDDPTNAHTHRYSTPSVRVQGTRGEIQIFGPLPRPQRVRVFTKVMDSNPPTAVKADNDDDTSPITPGNVVSMPGTGHGYRVQDRVFESMGDGNGMFWEADEVGRCLRDGKLQSDVMPWEETLAIMRLMDGARQMCGLDYGEDVEGIRLPRG